MSNATYLKAKGHLQTVELKDIGTLDVADTILQNVTGVVDYCGCPDLPDEEIAKGNVLDISQRLGMTQDEATLLQDSHSRMLAKIETGHGSWPAGCLDKYPDYHAITYYVDRNSFPSHFKREMERGDYDILIASSAHWAWRKEPYTEDEIRSTLPVDSILDVSMKICEQLYRHAGCIHVETDEHDGSNIHVEAYRLGSGIKGMAQFNSGRCGEHIWNRTQRTWQPRHVLDLIDLHGHEFGHNHDLLHEFYNQSWHRSIMSYDNKPWPEWCGFNLKSNYSKWPDDRSWPELRQQYGGENQIPADPTQPPDPPPTGSRIIWPKIQVPNGYQVIEIDGKRHTIKSREGAI